MRLLFTVLFLLAMVTGTLAQDTDLPAPPDDVVARLDGVLNNMLEDSLFFGPGAPGAVLLVETPDWRYVKAAGVASLESSDPITLDMTFEIGSNTKMMTSAIILQLQEEGLLNIDDPISDYLPDLAARIPNGDAITIEQMLRHRSGMWDYVDGSPRGEDGVAPQDGLFYDAIETADSMMQDYEPEELVEYAIENGQPVFEPGSLNDEGIPNFAYNNTGFVLLGLIIEEVTGEPVEVVFEARIFEPLGMTETTFVTGVPEFAPGLRGYYRDGESTLDATDFNLSMAYTAGAVVSTAEDMAVFITALLNGELFQEPETLALMQSDPVIGAPTGGNYALGLQDKSGGGLWGHGGETLAFESDVAYDVTTDMAIVAWTNGVPNAVATATSNTLSALLTPTFDDLLGTALVLNSYSDAETGESGEPGDRTYSITLNEDGTAAIQADCNQVTATWTMGEENALSIEPGITTLAECGPESFSDGFVDYLSRVTLLVIPTYQPNIPTQFTFYTEDFSALIFDPQE